MNRPRKRIYIIIRNDDLCAFSDEAHERRVLKLFEKYAVSQTLGVIPMMTEDPHDCRGDTFHPLTESPRIIALLEEYQNLGLIEIAQHGVRHQTNALHPSLPLQPGQDHRVPCLGGSWSPFDPAHPEWYSEFNGLPIEEQRRLIRSGAGLLTEIFGAGPQTFIFPWDSLNPYALAILTEQGFRTVLCSYPTFSHPGLNLIGYLHEDMFQLPKHMDMMAGKRGAVLLQVSYHSWMLDEQGLPRLESLLKGLSARKDVCFITARQAGQIFPQLNPVLSAHAQGVRIVQETYAHLSRKQGTPRYYLMNLFHYRLKNKVALAKLLFVKYVGFRKAILALVTAFLLDEIFLCGHNNKYACLHPQGIAWVLLAGIVVLVASRYRLKRSDGQPCSSEGSLPPWGANFRFMARRASQDFLDKGLVEQYFDAFEQLSAPSLKERVRFWQLKYYNGADEKAALNKLAGLYKEQGRFYPALMCLLESLRLDPAQEDVYLAAEKVGQQMTEDQGHEFLPDRCLVSVIMTTFQFRPEITEAVESVLGQTMQDFELIIVNDGGPKDVEALLDAMGSDKIRYFRLDRNQGIAGARNAGIRQARGKYICYLDDDDVYYPDHLAVLLDALRDGPAAAAYSVTSAVEGRQVEGRFVFQRNRFVWDRDFDRDTLVNNIYITTCAMMHRRDLFRYERMFRPDLTSAEDWDLWLRLARKTDFTHVHQVTSEYRLRGHNATLRDRVEASFLGKMVCRYHGLRQGRVALIKYLLIRGRREEAQIKWAEIKQDYEKNFRPDWALREMAWPALQLNDRDFLRQVLRDLFIKNFRVYLTVLAENRLWFVFGDALRCLIPKFIRILQKKEVLIN